MKFLELKGHAAEVIRRTTWRKSWPGPPETWSSALRLQLYTILSSAAPKLILWGDELITFYNDACAELIPNDPYAGIGKPYAEFRPAHWKVLRNAIQAASEGNSSSVPNFHPIGDEARHRTFQLFLSPLLNDDRAVSGVLIDVVDLSERAARERRIESEAAMLETLFSSTPVFIAYIAAKDMRLRYVNHAFAELFDHRPLAGRLVADAIPEAADQGFINLIEQVLASGTPWSGSDMPLIVYGSDGNNPRFVDFEYRAILGDGRQPVGLLCSGYGVTERHKARIESERLRHQLLHTTRTSAMGTMAMTVAHELNQPLTAAANFIWVTEQRLSGEAGAALEPLKAAREQILRAGKIVRRMRSVVEQGRGDIGTFDVRRSILQVIELLRIDGQIGELVIDVEVEENAKTGRADELQFEQVLLNLVRNAARACERSAEHRILISAKRDGASVVMRVEDDGPGLPSEVLSTLFMLNQTPGDQDSLGVGLSLCRTLVEANGGTIKAENQPGGGAAITFTLPAAER